MPIYFIIFFGVYVNLLCSRPKRCDESKSEQMGVVSCMKETGESKTYCPTSSGTEFMIFPVISVENPYILGIFLKAILEILNVAVFFNFLNNSATYLAPSIVARISFQKSCLICVLFEPEASM